MLQQERDRSGGTRKLISLEDPVEYAMDRVTQINVGEKSEIAHADTDFTFENLNQKMLRSDPDTIAYGEIRDNVSAKALYKGVESGHLVYGTIHTSTALDVFSRLRSFGLSLDDICKKGFIRLILLQHLLPKLCPHCSIPYHVGDEVPEKYDELFVIKSFMQTSNTRLTVSEVVKISKKNKGRSLLRALQAEERIGAIDVMRLRKKIQQLNEGSESRGFSDRLNSVISNSTLQEEDFNIRFRGHGCDKCLQGQCGVVPASEVIIPDERLLALIKSGDIQKASLYWKSHLGGKTAVQDSYGKIFDGSVDPRSVEEHLVDLLGSS
jgi:type II secretory ATPase GspE/PulE/Tfp pilus assembly ATPase PilB-like protein